MRSLIIVLALAAQTCVCGLVHAQPDVRAAHDRSYLEQPSVILIEVRPTLDSSLGAAFIATRPVSDPEFSHSEINLAVLSGDSTICNLLGGLSGLHGLRLQPFIPTHSVAFQDIRERSNPQLFGKTESVAYGAKNNSDLRSAEDKISHWFVLSFSDPISDDRAISLLQKSAFIERAEPKFIRHLCFTPNDPDVSQQYSLSLMHCFQAWDIVRCDSTMILADVDNGTDWTHEDLANAIYLNQGEIGIDANGLDKRYNGIDDDSNGYIDDWHGWDFAGADDYTPDNNPAPAPDEPTGEHGTHTAGIMAATGDNAKGIAGVAFGARVIPIKIGCDVCDALNHGFEGIVYAADMHAKVINCSWGAPNTYSQAEQDVINYAYAKDCAVVAACGNSYIYQTYYPGSYNHVLSVAAVDGNDRIVNFSTYNPQVDIAAPGWSVLSTVPGNQYATDEGTSMASPNAAGVVALVRQRFPTFTAGQAMEQVRVTGDSVTQISDAAAGTISGIDTSGRLYFEGHGEVDAFRAVTDTNTFSARVDSVTIDDNNHTGSFAPGESGGIVLNVRNYLKPLLALKARMEIVQGNSFVTLHQTVVPFGPVSTMGFVQNDPAALQVSVANNAPPNTQVLIRVFFYDTIVGYAEDYDYFSFTINPSYLDLNKNNVTVTFSSIGTIGYNDLLVNQEGSGFLWRVPHASILPYARSLLYQGGLMAGTDSDHVVDVIESNDPNVPDMDFSPEENVHYVTPPDHPNAVQELACSYSDSLADPSVQIGLHTQCHAYAFTGDLASNAIVVKYIFRHLNSVGTSIPPASDSTAAGLYLDWDIGPSGLNNITRFDTSRQMAMTYRIPLQGFPFIGVKLLSPLPPGAALNYHAIMNDGSQGNINAYAGLQKSDKWNAMTEFFNSAGPGDVTHTFGLKNMPLRSQDSVEMTMVIALAQDTATLGQTIDEAAALWAAKSGVGLEAPTAGLEAPAHALEAFPNPFQHALHIAWEGRGPARITIYDAMGRIVNSRTVAGSAYDFILPNLPSGFYTVDVLIGGTHLRKQVVAQE